MTMTIEFIGITATQRVDTEPGGSGAGMATHTEVGVPVGPPVNTEFAAELARAHEASGFDRVLIAHSSAIARRVRARRPGARRHRAARRAARAPARLPARRPSPPAPTPPSTPSTPAGSRCT